MRIGKLNIKWGTKAQKIVPGKTIFTLYGFQVVWLNSEKETIVKDGYLGNPDVFTVVNKVARTASYAPFKVYKIKNQAKHFKYKMWTGPNATKESVMAALRIKSEAYEEVNDHPLTKLIEKPNPWQKGREFSENSVGFKVLTGERFWHVVTLDAGANEGTPYAIYNLPPQHMVVKGDGTLLGIESFMFQLTSKEIDVNSIIFSRYWNPGFDTAGSHLRGVSPFSAGIKLLTRSDSVLSRSVNMLDKAGAAGVLFEKPVQGFTEMTEEQAGALKVKVNKEVLGVDNANSIAVANGDLGYINFGLKGTEMELIQLEKLTMERICALINVPPVLFNTERTIQNNLQEAKKELVIAACCPELDSIRDDWNEVAKLYKDDTIYVDYDLSVYPELQEDLDKVTTRNATAWWKTPNEKRLSEYMDEDKDNPLMDEYFIPTGLQLLSDMNVNQTDQALNDTTGNQAGSNA